MVYSGKTPSSVLPAGSLYLIPLVPPSPRLEQLSILGFDNNNADLGCEPASWGGSMPRGWQGVLNVLSEKS